MARDNVSYSLREARIKFPEISIDRFRDRTSKFLNYLKSMPKELKITDIQPYIPSFAGIFECVGYPYVLCVDEKIVHMVINEGQMEGEELPVERIRFVGENSRVTNLVTKLEENLTLSPQKTSTSVE